MLLAGGEVLIGPLADREICLSSGFGAGVGDSKEELCGAFSGGVMVIGGLLGRSDPSADDSACQALVRQYRERFLRKFETLTCGELRQEKFGSQGAEPCSVLVERAVALLLELIDEHQLAG